MQLPISCLMNTLFAWLLLAAALPAQTKYDPNVLPRGEEYYVLRGGLANCQRKFEVEKSGRIVFLGGSITAGGAWREHTMRYFREKFPQTKFEFVNAGISSLGSVPHAFRLERDVLAHGPADLLFVEAAVNDTTNTADPAHMLRGMEGIVRHIRTANPLTDIIHLHFVMPEHMADYDGGHVPASIAQHERVAEAYRNPSLNLSREVTDRIHAGQFTWDGDFKNLHPSPFGHQLYAHSIARLLDAAFARPLAPAPRPHAAPPLLDPHSYVRGRLGNIAEAERINGFELDPKWSPGMSKGVRAGFVDVPALIGTQPGAEFAFQFEGTGVGLFITSGPDAGPIEFSIDGSAYRRIDTFTRWSSSLHLPWAVILDDQLPAGRHTVHVRIAKASQEGDERTALRVFHLLLN